MAPGDVQRLLDSCDRATLGGARNYAIMLLGTLDRHGTAVHEIANRMSVSRSEAYMIWGRCTATAERPVAARARPRSSPRARPRTLKRVSGRVLVTLTKPRDGGVIRHLIGRDHPKGDVFHTRSIPRDDRCPWLHAVTRSTRGSDRRAGFDSFLGPPPPTVHSTSIMNGDPLDNSAWFKGIDATSPLLKGIADVQANLATSPLLKGIADVQANLATSPLLKGIADVQANLATSPLLKGIADVQANLATSPLLKGIADVQANLATSPLLKGIADVQANLATSPLLKGIADVQANLATSPLLKGIADVQANLATSPLLKGIADVQANLATSPLLKGIADVQANLATSPLLKGIADVQANLATSPLLKGIADVQANLATSFQNVLNELQTLLRAGVIKGFEAADRYVEEHNWADAHTENAMHPQPILFVVSSFTREVGLPLYQAVKTREDDTILLQALEEVYCSPALVAGLIRAVDAAPLINPIQKNHLRTALSWLSRRSFVNAYPPFYQGLEAALYAAAQNAGVIDDRKRFISRKGKASKVDDVLDDVIDDVEFKRFLRCWIFGNRGNSFRHGEVSDLAECRRQTLRLAVALTGWLEIFGGIGDSGIRELIEAEAAFLIDERSTA